MHWHHGYRETCMHKHDLFNSGLFTFHLTGVENTRHILSASCQTISLLSKSYYNLTTRCSETMAPFERMRMHLDALNITLKQIHLITSTGCKSTWNKLVPFLPAYSISNLLLMNKEVLDFQTWCFKGEDKSNVESQSHLKVSMSEIKSSRGSNSSYVIDFQLAKQSYSKLKRISAQLSQLFLLLS